MLVVNLIRFFSFFFHSSLLGLERFWLASYQLSRLKSYRLKGDKKFSFVCVQEGGMRILKTSSFELFCAKVFSAQWASTKVFSA